MRVVDANVLVSGIPASSGPIADIVRAWQDGTITLVLSEHILDEVARAWTKPYWQARMTPALRDAALGTLRAEADIVPIAEEIVGVAPHAADDLVLATAVSGRADALVTGDKPFLAIGEFRGVVLLTPEALLSLLEESEDDR
jgi:putative PIN family toxin of toxin-antitoxin system